MGKEALERAITAAKAETTRPSLICCKTIIGWGSPNKQGTEATHGAALGDAAVAAARQHLGWPYEPFVIPDDIKAASLPVLRHRVQLAPEVAMGGQSMDEVLKGIVDSVPAPRQ